MNSEGMLQYVKGLDITRQLPELEKSCITVKKGQPMTEQLLEKIRQVVDFSCQKQFVVWVSLLTGFFLILRKSNLVLLSRMHDAVHNITHQDVRYGRRVMLVFIHWSKTNQYRQKISKFPMLADNNHDICPIRWILHMVDCIPAAPSHNLFSFIEPNGMVLPITYRDLMVNLRNCLKLVGVTNPLDFSSHSLRRGGTTKAFKQNIAERTIMEMGGWTSQCYKQYIEVDIETKLKAWHKFTHRK